MIYVIIGGHVFPVMHCADLSAGGKEGIRQNSVQLGS